MVAKNYYSPEHKLALENAYLVIDSLNLRYNRKGFNAFPPSANSEDAEKFEPSVDVSSFISVYASQFAYDSNSQSLHSRNLSFKTANGTQEEIEAEILKLVQIVPK